MNFTPKLEKATLDDFEKVFPLLMDFNNPKISREQWRNLFFDYWGFNKSFCGYKLVVGDQVVGFMAYILSKKLINNRWENFCDLSSWIVKPEFRKYSIDLLYPILELKDHTIISFTPTVGAYNVETKLFKLKEFDWYEVIMLALPCFPALFKTKFKIHIDKKSSPHFPIGQLSEYEKKIFDDHAKFDCEHIVITSGEGNLYLILKKTYRRRLPFYKIYYASNIPLFLDLLDALRFRIPLKLKSAGIIVDSRFLKDKYVPLKKKKKFYMPMLYKSERVQPHEVDYLYSEFFLLGF